MATREAGTILRHVRALLGADPAGNLSDAELLRRYAALRDEAAFAALMHRHGGLVWGVCRRLLREAHDAEDAFQATFLVLAKKAGSVRSGEAVGSWLYGVAYRVAMKAKQSARKREAHE